MRPLFTLASFALLLAAGPLAARDIYVNNVTGDDRRGGSAAETSGAGGPCRSIAKALRIAQRSDRIVIANTGQPYRESITLQGSRHSGDDRFPFMLIGNGAVLDGRASMADAVWEYVTDDTFRTRPLRMSFQQLFLDNQPAERKQPSSGQPPALAPLQWLSMSGWIYFRVEPGKLPSSY